MLLALARIDGYDLVGKACPLDEQSNHGSIGSGWNIEADHDIFFEGSI